MKAIEHACDRCGSRDVETEVMWTQCDDYYWCCGCCSAGSHLMAGGGDMDPHYMVSVWCSACDA